MQAFKFILFDRDDSKVYYLIKNSFHLKSHLNMIYIIDIYFVLIINYVQIYSSTS